VPAPVYAPALVGFLGGPGVGLYVSGAVGPQIGWFPLAPGEIYWPSYSRNVNYIRNINIANVTNINNINIRPNADPRPEVANAQFVNRRFATVVPQPVFASGSKVDPVAAHPGALMLERAPVTTRTPQIRPTLARAVPGPTASRMRGQPGSMPVAQGQQAGTEGRLPSLSDAAAVPPHLRTAQASTTASLPPWHPGRTPPHGGTAVTPMASPGGARLHPPAQAFHPPAQAFHPPPPAFHPPAQAFHPTPAFHPSQQVAHAPPAPRGGGAPQASPNGSGAAAHGGGGKSDKHD
jgi:hypothetical protein